MREGKVVGKVLECEGILESKFGGEDGEGDEGILCALGVYDIFGFMVWGVYGM